jgi:hypothetical protein
MEQKNGLTLVGLIFTIVIVLFVLVIIIPLMMGVDKNIRNRVVCASKLKGLGIALLVYARDYDGNYPQLPGTGPWSKELGFAFDTEKPDFSETGQQGQSGDQQCKLYCCKKQMFHRKALFAHLQQKYFDGKKFRESRHFDLWVFFEAIPNTCQIYHA